MGAMRLRVASIALLVACSAVSTSCGGNDGGGSTAVVAATHVPTLVLGAIQPSPFLSYKATPFSLFGQGFARTPKPSAVAAPGAMVTITFTASDETPFADGTSATADVQGTVVSDTEIQGISPVTNVPGGIHATVTVTDVFGSATTAEPIAAFAGLVAFDVTEQDLAASDAKPFELLGMAFEPAGGQATVRFTSLVPGAFPGGADFLDVPVDVLDSGRLSGITPAFATATPVLAYVTVILDQVPGAPSFTAPDVLVTFREPPVIPVVVTSITSPVPLGVSTLLTIDGSGFLGVPTDANVSVTFVATAGTPFLGATSADVTVPGIATADGIVVVASPVGTSATDVFAFVTVTRVDGIEGTSATAIAHLLFPVPAVTAFSPDVVVESIATPFVIDGVNLPAGLTAIVRFTAVMGTPFAGGTSETADVVATVTTSVRIDGTTPLALTTEPVEADVEVILPDGTDLSMGDVCTFLPQPAPSMCVVTNLNDSGPGSLREELLQSPTCDVITFDPALSGTIVVASPLVMPHGVVVRGRGHGAIIVSGAGGSFPIFDVPVGVTADVEELHVVGSHDPDNGGAFRVRGTLMLTRCVLDDHDVGGKGAALEVENGGTAVLRECTIADCFSKKGGGAVFVENNATVQAFGCTFRDNHAGGGGGAVSLANGGTFEAVNCTFHKNHADGGPGGGAILVGQGSTVQLVHCTVTENTADNRGGGVHIQGTLVAANCIFSRNADAKGDLEISNRGGTNDTTFSLVRVNTGSGLTNGAAGNKVGTPAAPLDPKLLALAHNGGATETQLLHQGSPAIASGDPAACTPTDQRHRPRPAGGATCDLGSVEVSETP